MKGKEQNCGAKGRPRASNRDRTHRTKKGQKGTRNRELIHLGGIVEPKSLRKIAEGATEKGSKKIDELRQVKSAETNQAG